MQDLTQKQRKQQKPPSFRAQRSGVEKSFHAEASRRNSRNSGNSRHFERSGAESRNPFTPKHCEERKNLTQITQIFTEIPVRRRIMLASERITRSREAELSRRKSRNSGNSRHFERSGAESRNPFMQKHCEERKNLTQIAQITRIFLFYANRCPLMPAKAGWQISQNRTERKRKHSRYQSAGWLALASTKCGRKSAIIGGICER